MVVAADEEEWMQSWAMENNLSETAFLQQLPSQVERQWPVHFACHSTDRRHSFIAELAPEGDKT